MKKHKFFIIAGQFSLFLGLLGFIVNSFYLGNVPILSFITGVLLGLSLVFNLSFLIKIRKGQ